LTLVAGDHKIRSRRTLPMVLHSEREIPMTFKSAVMIAAATAAAGFGFCPIEARADAVACTVVPQIAPIIYPAPNWEPFFRRHYWRYGLVPTCIPSAAPPIAVSGPVISVRY